MPNYKIGASSCAIGDNLGKSSTSLEDDFPFSRRLVFSYSTCASHSIFGTGCSIDGYVSTRCLFYAQTLLFSLWIPTALLFCSEALPQSSTPNRLSPDEQEQLPQSSTPNRSSPSEYCRLLGDTIKLGDFLKYSLLPP